MTLMMIIMFPRLLLHPVGVHIIIITATIRGHKQLKHAADEREEGDEEFHPVGSIKMSDIFRELIIIIVNVICSW